MSAYVVSNETINCLVNGMIDHRVIGRIDAEMVGQMLLDQNQRSVNYRYSESNQAPKFKFERKGDMFGGVLIDVKAVYSDSDIYGCIQCWEYQSCENPGHDTSTAWMYVERLEREIIEKKFPDYPWGLE